MEELVHRPQVRVSTPDLEGEPLENGTIQVIVRTSKGTQCLSRSATDLKRKYVYVNAEEIWP